MSVFFFNVTKNKQYSENYLMLNADAIADIYKSARDIFESVRDIFRKYESARDNCPWHFLKIWPWHFFLYPWQFPVKCPWHLKVPVTNLKKKMSRPLLNVTGKIKNTYPNRLGFSKYYMLKHLYQIIIRSYWGHYILKHLAPHDD